MINKNKILFLSIVSSMIACSTIVKAEPPKLYKDSDGRHYYTGYRVYNYPGGGNGLREGYHQASESQYTFAGNGDRKVVRVYVSPTEVQRMNDERASWEVQAAAAGQEAFYAQQRRRVKQETNRPTPVSSSANSPNYGSDSADIQENVAYLNRFSTVEQERLERIRREDEGPTGERKRQIKQVLYDTYWFLESVNELLLQPENRQNQDQSLKWINGILKSSGLKFYQKKTEDFTLAMQFRDVVDVTAFLSGYANTYFQQYDDHIIGLASLEDTFLTQKEHNNDKMRFSHNLALLIAESLANAKTPASDKHRALQNEAKKILQNLQNLGIIKSSVLSCLGLF